MKRNLVFLGREEGQAEERSKAKGRRGRVDGRLADGDRSDRRPRQTDGRLTHRSSPPSASCSLSLRTDLHPSSALFRHDAPQCSVGCRRCHPQRARAAHRRSRSRQQRAPRHGHRQGHQLRSQCITHSDGRGRADEWSSGHAHAHSTLQPLRTDAMGSAAAPMRRGEAMHGPSPMQSWVALLCNCGHRQYAPPTGCVGAVGISVSHACPLSVTVSVPLPLPPPLVIPCRPLPALACSPV